MTSSATAMTSPETLLKQVGIFGVFQKRSLLTIYLVTLLSPSIVMMCSIFVTYSPPHRCHIPEIDDVNSSLMMQNNFPEIPTDYEKSLSNSSDDVASQLARYIPVEVSNEGKPKWSQCYRYENASQHGTSQDQILISCNSGWKYDVNPGLSSAVTEFDLVCDRAWLAPLPTSMIVVGFMIGNIVGGYVSDRWGRRSAYYISSLISIICLVVVIFLPWWEAGFLFWFLSGAAFVSRVTSGVVMINEVTPTKYRYAASLINMLSAAGSYMLVSALNYLVQNWRHYLALHAAIQIVAFIPSLIFLKESLRWLLQHGKIRKALLLLKTIAKVNNKEFEHDSKLLERDDSNLTKEEENGATKDRRRMTYIDFARISFLRKRIIILAIAWIAVTTNYYGLSINTNNLGGDRYVACFISGAMEIPGDVLSFFGLKKLGGRRAFMMMIGGSGLFLSTTPALFYVNRTAVIVSNMIGKLFATGAFSTLYVFLGEFFPTLLRIQAYGASSFPSRLTSMLVPYLVYIGDHYAKAVPYFVMGSTAIAAAVGMCFLPETRKQPLPDTLEDARRQENNTPVCLSCSKKAPKEEDINDNIIFEPTVKEI